MEGCIEVCVGDVTSVISLLNFIEHICQIAQLEHKGQSRKKIELHHYPPTLHSEMRNFIIMSVCSLAPILLQLYTGELYSYSAITCSSV